MSTKQAAASSGIGFSGLLTILFVGAKLWDKIDWSWWWVCSPLWVPPLIVIGVLALVMAFSGIVWVIATIAERFVGTPKKRPAQKVSK